MQSKKILSYLIASLLFTSSFAGNLQKAFEALHIYDYFEAKKLFTKQLKGDSVGGGYGLSVIYSRNDNPFYQTDSALKFILLANRKFSSLDEKLKGKLFAVGIDQNEIYDQKQRVSQLFYKMALDSMTTKAFNDFILNHDWFNNKTRAILIRDSLAFDDASQENSWQAFQFFYKTYYNSRQAPASRNKYDLLFYQDKTGNKSLAEHEKFILEFPKSPYNKDAQDRIYEISTKSETRISYYNFIKKYPKNKNVEEAWEVIYKKSVKRNDPIEITNFILDYPNYPFREEALLDYSLSNETYYPFRAGNKWGFIDEKSKVVIEPKYDWVEQYSEGLALVGKNEMAGYINKRGKENVAIKYTDGATFTGGHAWIELDGKYGLVNSHGSLVLNAVYENIGNFSESRIYVQKDGKYGFYNSKMKLVIEHQYSSVSDFRSKRSIVELNGKKGVIDLLGAYIIPMNYDQIIYQEKEQTYLLEIDGKFGMMNRNGDTIIDFKYDLLSNIRENRILFSAEGKYGYLNYKGREVVSPEHDFDSKVNTYGTFENGVAKTKSKGKFGLIDTSGNKVYPHIFEDIGTYSTITPVKKNGRWGYSNANVKLVIKYKYSYAEGFNYGLARVEQDGKWGIIDENGNSVIAIKYEELIYFENYLLLVKLNGKWGLYNRNNEELFPIIYDVVKVYDKKMLLLIKEGKQAYYNLKEKDFLFKEQGF